MSHGGPSYHRAVSSPWKCHLCPEDTDVTPLCHSCSSPSSFGLAPVPAHLQLLSGVTHNGWVCKTILYSLTTYWISSACYGISLAKWTTQTKTNAFKTHRCTTSARLETKLGFLLLPLLHEPMKHKSQQSTPFWRTSLIMTMEAIQPLVMLALQEPGMEEKQGQHVTDLHQFLSLMSNSSRNVSYL